MSCEKGSISMDYEKVGIFLYELRKSRGLTQKDIANRFYITREAVSKWERGLCLPDYPILVALSQFYNITINEILLGQRIDNINKDAIEAVTINIIKTTDKKIKKTKYIATIAILLVICVMLFMYFIYNYNSIKIYTVSAANDDYIVKNGELYIYKNKASLNLGLISSTNNEILTRDDGYKIKVYYDKDNKKVFYNANDLDSIYINLYSFKEATRNVSLDEVLDDLYIDIIKGDKVSTIKINFDIYYENDFKSIFFGNNERFYLKNKEDDSNSIREKSEIYINGEKYDVDKEDGVIKLNSENGNIVLYYISDKSIKLFTDDAMFNYYSDNYCSPNECTRYEKYVDIIRNKIEELGLN